MRSVWFVTAGVDYFPWGKPELPESREGRNPVALRLAAARPYFEGALGYVNLKGVAKVDIHLPKLESVFHYQDKARYDLIYWSPRLGVEIPITRDNSVSFRCRSARVHFPFPRVHQRCPSTRSFGTSSRTGPSARQRRYMMKDRRSEGGVGVVACSPFPHIRPGDRTPPKRSVRLLPPGSPPCRGTPISQPIETFPLDCRLSGFL